MSVTLTVSHWLFLFWVFVVILVMGMRKDPLIPCIFGLLTVGWSFKQSILGAITTVYNALIVAGNEFWGIIVIISLIAALSKLLSDTGADYLVMAPAAKLMVNADIAFWVLGISMMLASWFFWPSPATALIGAIMFPVAVRAGLPAIGAAMAMNLFGHGIALSTDFVIQGAPTITAKAAGFSSPAPVIAASIPLIITMGLVTTITAFIMIKRDIKNDPESLKAEQAALKTQEIKREITAVSYFLAWATPIAFAADVIAMWVFKLRGGDATALLGATAVLLLSVGCLLKEGWDGLEKVTDYLRDGFMFGIKIFAPVIIIGGFFFLGKGELAQSILDAKNATGFLEDFGLALSQSIPLNKFFVALVSLATGIVVGLDGSGFSPLPLVGSVAATFGKAMEIDKATLAALGQIAGVWTGGGTIIPWGLIPVAAITGVNPIELARRNFIPVALGFAATTVVAVFLL
ncbi:hypothetical protein AXX12_07175 [Anaerosporomusa subterranea]|uniref:Transporter n=1 Tax=Anaerosporomusa subterranea TaxID=1794912 RepID=A0A154BQT0_ANASB|nr:hypothetical protein [Anaerosporomusa subterranea]KYZ76215.1 hypothetical protein AXX12_07175 [Anaerosporomusa subterranea]